MRRLNQQFVLRHRPAQFGPFVVSGPNKNISRNRDGPLIFHTRDGPIFVTGPPGGTGPPTGTGPPDGTGPPGGTGPPLNKGSPHGTGPPYKQTPGMQTRQNRQQGQHKNISQIRRETMKKVKPIRLLSLLLAGSFGLMQAPSVFAAAGVPIGNTATINYEVGGATQTEIESAPGAGNSTPGAGAGTATEFVEDRLINFTVTRGGSTGQVTPGATLQWTEFTVDNTGNATQDFLLAGFNNGDGIADPQGGNADSFDATAGTIQTFVESNPVPDGFQPATDTAIFIDDLAAGAQATVYVVSTIPLDDSGGNTLVNGDVAVMTLVAHAAESGAGQGAAITNDDNSHTSPGGDFSGVTVNPGIAVTNPDGAGTMETVFGDADGTQDGTGTGDPDTQYNAQHSDDNSYTVQSAALTVTKTSIALWDDINANNNPKSMPGGYVRYTIIIENTGTVPADLTTIVDDLAPLLDIDPDLGSGNLANDPEAGVGNTGQSFRMTHSNGASAFCTAAADADTCSYAPAGPGGTVTIDIGTVMGPDATLANGDTMTVIFNAIVVLP